MRDVNVNLEWWEVSPWPTTKLCGISVENGQSPSIVGSSIKSKLKVVLTAIVASISTIPTVKWMKVKANSDQVMSRYACVNSLEVFTQGATQNCISAEKIVAPTDRNLGLGATIVGGKGPSGCFVVEIGICRS